MKMEGKYIGQVMKYPKNYMLGSRTTCLKEYMNDIKRKGWSAEAQRWEWRNLTKLHSVTLFTEVRKLVGERKIIVQKLIPLWGSKVPKACSTIQIRNYKSALPGASSGLSSWRHCERNRDTGDEATYWKSASQAKQTMHITESLGSRCSQTMMGR